MGLVYAEIELINADDLALVRKHLMDKDEVKQIRINMLVDSGAYMMAINEAIQEVLQLPFREKKKAQLADGSVIEYDVVGPIDVRFKNRTSVCNAVILKGNNEPLFGAIPMEEMDVMIHPLTNQLIVNPAHPDMAQLSMK
jgi:clan AA aspartic protease